MLWFNSEFHRKSFIDAIPGFLNMMPDGKLQDMPERISEKSKVLYPGISDFPASNKKRNDILTILWAARWEHDKNPDDFFEALKRLKEKGVNFRLNVIGERFEEVPPVFERAKDYFKNEIQIWGFQKSREDYVNALSGSDIIVSTAKHEFFGISVVEAIAAGCYPLLPDRLSYPEIVRIIAGDKKDSFLYDGWVDGLVGRLSRIAKAFSTGSLWRDKPDRSSASAVKFSWSRRALIMDDALDRIISRSGSDPSLAGEKPDNS